MPSRAEVIEVITEIEDRPAEKWDHGYDEGIDAALAAIDRGKHE